MNAHANAMERGQRALKDAGRLTGLREETEEEFWARLQREEENYEGPNALDVSGGGVNVSRVAKARRTGLPSCKALGPSFELLVLNATFVFNRHGRTYRARPSVLTLLTCAPAQLQYLFFLFFPFIFLNRATTVPLWGTLFASSSLLLV